MKSALGPVVDEVALVRALRSGQIAGARLDVYEYEPEMIEDLVRVTACVVLLPHLGSAIENTRLEMVRLCASGIRRVLACERPDNVANLGAFELRQEQT